MAGAARGFAPTAGLPTYAFQRERFWLQERDRGSAAALGQSAAGHPLLGAAVSLVDDSWLFTGRLALREHPWLADHVVLDTTLMPGTGLVELALAAGRRAGTPDLQELTLQAPLLLEPEGTVQVQLTVAAADSDGRREIKIFSRPQAGAGAESGEPWTCHASGTLGAADGPVQSTPAGAPSEQWPPLGAQELAGEDLYERLAAAGYDYGPAFRGLRGAWRHGEELLAEVALDADRAQAASGFEIHPALLDAAAQLLLLDGLQERSTEGAKVPFSFGGVCVRRAGASELRIRVRALEQDGAESAGWSLLASDSAGAPVLSIDALHTRAIDRGALQRAGRAAEDLYVLDWTPLAGAPGLAPPPGRSRGALAGLGDGQRLREYLPESERHPALEALAEALAAGRERPECVLVEVGAEHPGEPPGLSGKTDEEAGEPSDPGARAGVDLPALTRAGVSSVLELLQAWIAEARFEDCSLVLLTSGAVAARAGEAVSDLPGSAIWGLVRAAQAEHPGRFLLTDIDDAPGSWELLRKLLASDGRAELGDQLAIRGGEAFTARLAAVKSAGVRGEDGVGRWRLSQERAGTLDELRWAPAAERDRALGAGEVRVGLHAAGLNFRDVMVALGMYPGGGTIGIEGAGVVLEVGAEVSDLEVGDRVMGMLSEGLGSVASLDRRLLARVPQGWSMAQAASVPTVFLTAYHALVDLAGLQAGERLLVHAAAGGVGMAAVRLAGVLGAEVYATASPEKWPVLEEAGIERGRIASSREAGFGEQFLRESAGAGMDVVLNSLAGEFVDASLGLLGEGGRFLEMGKTDVRETSQVAESHPGVAYGAFDISEVSPQRIQEMLGELLELFERGALEPLPTRTWDVARAPEAFRFMSQARHIGKNVLRLPVGRIDARGTVLVTGGTGGLGGLVARHLVVVHGVRSLLLVSRSGLEAEGVGGLVEELVGLGAEVRVRACDVSDRGQVRGLLGEVPAGFPLCGVVHAAGVLEDGVIGSLSVGGVGRVLAPKVDGAWYLHELTAGLDLQMFVLFSSVAGVVGVGGQGNYAAGNAFLDGLAAFRRARGLAGVAVAWGPWEQGVGMTGRLGEGDVARMARGGMLALSVGRGLELFYEALGGGESGVVAARLDFGVLRARARVGELRGVLAGLVGRPVVRGGGGVVGVGSLAGRLAGVPVGERRRVVLELVRAQAAVVLGHGGGELVAPGRAFKELGFDSLAAVELRNRLQAVVGVRLAPTVVFDHPSPVRLAERLLGLLEGEGERVRVARPRVRVEEPVAIVGMACRLPGGVSSPADLWSLLDREGDAIGEFPQDRGWDLERLYDPDPSRVGTCYTRRGGFLHDAGDFDAEFFGIGPREALAMDPQQRLLLETAWEAIEHAGIDAAELRGTQTGVFAGVISSGYARGLSRRAQEDLEGYRLTGATASVASGRLAYLFGLEGPAVTVDTACSSSLVALHMAGAALRGGECSLALAGGVTIMATPELFLEFSRQRGLAADGRCKSFADAADGTGWGEGVGVLVLERLSDAERNGHRVLGLIRGSAVNQDGASNGLTAPNGLAQQRVILQALANAGLSPAEVDAVEAHGTGTRLGDPIEAQALMATYGQDRDRPLWLGSIKSNIGHTQAAAGVAGVIKMVQALRHEELPRTLHMEQPTSEVDWSAGAVSLLREAVPWRRREQPRRAGVSSFGISGTNAHVILEEAPRPTGSSPAPQAAVKGTLAWVLSARGEQALRGQAGRLGAFAAEELDVGEHEIALALARRAALEDRAVVLGASRSQLLGGLEGLARGQEREGLIRGRAPGAARLAFLFAGQGAQRVGMGRQLYETSTVFRAAFEEACGHLEESLGHALRGVIFGESTAGEPAGAQAAALERTAYAQSSLFALEVALGRLLESCGVRPEYVLGHSIGELAGACVAGAFSIEDGSRLVAARGRLMEELAGGGAMVAVQASEPEALRSLTPYAGEVSLAAVNAPAAVVLSGEREAIAQLREEWAQQGRKTRVLQVSHAFHSRRMEPMLEEFARVAASVEFAEPRIPIVSSVTGQVVSLEEFGRAEYWVRNVRDTVRFAQGVDTLRAGGVNCYLELAPDAVLSAMVHECLADAGEEEGAAVVVPILRGEREETPALLSALGEVWVGGVEVRWEQVLGGVEGPPLELPTYAFQRERFWVGSGLGSAGGARGVGLVDANHPLLGAATPLADGEGGWLFTARLCAREDRWLLDHAVLGTAVLPGTAFLEFALYAGAQVGARHVRDLTLRAPLVLEEEQVVQLQIALGAEDEAGRYALNVYSRAEVSGGEELGGSGDWVHHAEGVLDASGGAAQDVLAALESPGGGWEELADGAWPPASAIEIDVAEAYDALAETGLEYGEAFRGLRRAWRRGEEVFGEVALSEAERDRAGAFALHPALLDAALHAGAGVDAVRDDAPGGAGARLPFAWGEVSLFASGASLLRVRAAPAGESAISLLVADAGGAPVLAVGSLATREVSGGALAEGGSRLDRASLLAVRWTAAGAEADGAVGESAVAESAVAESVAGESAAGGRAEWALLGEAGAAMAGELDGAADRSGAYRDLAELLDAGGPVPRVVVAGTTPVGSEEEHLPALTRTGVSSVLELLQAWIAEARLEDARLVILTSGAVVARAEETLSDLAGGAVRGLVRCAQAEHPGRFVLIDLDGEASSRQALAALLSGERRLDAGEYALRAGELLAPRLAPPETSASADGARQARLEELARGTVLVTGGTGGLGGLVARHLVVVHGVRSLLLVSRSGLEAEGVGGLVEELVGLGAEVRVRACDVSDRGQVRGLLGEVPAGFPLCGVVHAAGVLDDGVIGSLSVGGVGRVLAPKVDGAWYLHELTAGLDLQMFVLFSSVAGVVGVGGQGNYAAGNARFWMGWRRFVVRGGGGGWGGLGGRGSSVWG